MVTIRNDLALVDSSPRALFAARAESMKRVRAHTPTPVAAEAVRPRVEVHSPTGDELLLLVYAELKQVAGRFMRGQRSDHTLQPTSLVHEAYMKLVNGDVSFRDRKHFVRAAAHAMRQILVDHARAKNRGCRKSLGSEVPLEGIAGSYETRSGDLVALDEALTKLAAIDPDLVRVVELRFFACLSVDECAAVLQEKPARIAKDLKIARGWLRGAMS